MIRNRTARPQVECLEDRCVPANLITGFTESLVASGLSSPTAMEFAPNGDLWILQQGGTVKRFAPGDTAGDVVGRLNNLGLTSSGERGLLGIAFDPDYATNKKVFLYYTTTDGGTHNRVSTFTVNDSNSSDYFFTGTTGGGTTGTPTQSIILELDALSGATNHNGGAIHFGPDGKLYIAVGDNANGSNSQTLSNLHGKILRINADGSIPSTNPFFNTATGQERAIWALGLRNPFTFAFQPGTGRMHINDVGQNAFEEINNGVAGANYGWPGIEGNNGTPPGSPGTYRAPFHVYGHGGGTFEGFAITGGAFYNPTTQNFPDSYVGDYFFADFVNDWIHVIDLNNGNVREFATSAGSPVDLRVKDDGSLYYLSFGDGTAHRVVFTASQAPNITDEPDDATVSAGGTASFTVAATGAGLSYQWQKFNGSAWVDLSNGNGVSGVNATTLVVAAVDGADAGQYRVRVSNGDGSDTSRAATLTVTANQRPTASISIDAGLTAIGKFIAGQEITFSGSASDPEDGTLAASAFDWKVEYITSINSGNPAVRPFEEFSNTTTASFTPATTGPYTKADVAYRVTLTVTDSGGLTRTVTRDLSPKVATLTVKTNPAGLVFTVDAQPYTSRRVFNSVAGFEHPLGAASQTFNGKAYDFVSWSDGGAAQHTIVTPRTNTTYTATFAPAFEARINFQTATSPGFARFLVDTGATLGTRGNGLNYGWNADNTANATNRNSSLSPDERYDTTIATAGRVWEIAVPNGTYQVRLVFGDAVLGDSVFRSTVENVLAEGGVPTADRRWIQNDLSNVVVTDGRLTISDASGAVNNKLCFVKIVLVSRNT